MLPQALKGTRVVEWAGGVAAPYAGRLLMDQGAQVIKIEAPGTGDWTRAKGPFKDLTPGPSSFDRLSDSHRSPIPSDRTEPERRGEARGDMSGLFFYYNVGKKGITLRPETERGRKLFLDLVRQADVLIEDQVPGRMEELGLGYEHLQQINPRLIMLSVTPFGETGPYRRYKTYPLIDLHAGGEGWTLVGEMTGGDRPVPVRPPAVTGGDTTETYCGLMAAMGVVAALWRRRNTGKGNHVDMSKQEASMWPARVELAGFPNEGLSDRRSTREKGIGGVMPCKDGFVHITPFEEHMWQGLVEAMGRPAWAENPRYKDRLRRFAAHSEVNPLIEAWTRQRTAKEVYEALQANRCPAFEVATLDKVAASEHYAARGYFTEVEDPVLGTVKLPTTPFMGPKPSYAPAPRLGEHNEEVYSSLGVGLEDIEGLRAEGVI